MPQSPRPDEGEQTNGQLNSANGTATVQNFKKAMSTDSTLLCYTILYLEGGAEGILTMALFVRSGIFAGFQQGSWRFDGPEGCVFLSIL